MTQKLTFSSFDIRVMLLNLLIFILLSIQVKATDQIIPKQIKNSNCRLKLGWVVWQPYQYYDGEQNIKGLQFELLEKIARQADCQFELVNLNWHQVQQGLRNGTVDVSPDASITEKRKTYANFSIPYRPELMALYLRPEEQERFIEPNLIDLTKKGFRFGLNIDHYYGETIAQLLASQTYQNQFIQYEHTHDSYHALFKNEVDGFFDDPMVFSFTARVLDYDRQFIRHPVILIRSEVSLMFSKKTVPNSTIERFNQAIAAVKKSNYYLRRWQW